MLKQNCAKGTLLLPALASTGHSVLDHISRTTVNTILLPACQVLDKTREDLHLGNMGSIS